MADVVVVGIGRIGLPVVANLVAGGHLVHAVDVRAEVATSVISVGASWAGATLDRVAAAQVLMTVLPGSPELRSLMFGDAVTRGLLDRMEAGSSWIDLTSAAPDLGVELAAAASGRGVHYLDAALGGGVPAARDATLTLYVGGPSDVLARHRALLETIAGAGRIRHLGGHGAGYLAKLLINLLWFGQAVAVGEALLLGQRAGLEPRLLGEVLTTSAASSSFVRDYLPRLLTGDYLPDFGLDRCVEELDSIERLAQSAATPFGLSAKVAETYRGALAHFGAVDGELMGVAYLEELAGRRLADETPRGG